MTRFQREEAGIDAADPRAATPLGVLAALGVIEADEHRAGECYERSHQLFWGGMPGRPEPMPRSHLAVLIASESPALWDLGDDDRMTQHRRCGAILRECVLRMVMNGRAAFNLTEDIIVYQRMPKLLAEARQRPLAAFRGVADLRACLAELMHVYGIRPKPRAIYQADPLA